MLQEGGDALKIGYFINHFPYPDGITGISQQYHCGGAENAAYYLALEMAERGHDITVFTTSPTSECFLEEHDRVKIYRYGTNLRISTSNVSWGQFRVPVDQSFDIIHTHFDLAPGPLAGLRYAMNAHLPLIVTYHGDWIDTYGGVLRRLGVAISNRYFVNTILNYANTIISPSATYVEKSRFLRLYKGKTAVIPNGINLRNYDALPSKEECRFKLGFSTDGKILLFFGYLSPYKGPDTLIRAFAIVLAAVPNVTLVFAGDGMMRSGLENLARQLGVEKSVRFVGYVDDNLKPLYYKAADVFCLPSKQLTESFGIVNLEAMAVGTAIVASNIGGIPDVVKDGENGLLVPPNDEEKLAHAIICLLNNDDLRTKLGRCGGEKVKLYSWETIASKTLDVYEHVVSSNHHRS